MTQPVDLDNGDPALEAINKTITVTRAMFSASGPYGAPLGGATDVVHFIPGEGPVWDPLAGRNSEADDEVCPNPFVYVRLASRYCTTEFPDPNISALCNGIPVINLDIGVGRCVDMGPFIDYKASRLESEWGLDDSFRLDRLVCVLKGELPNHQIAAEPIIPYGPDGGGIIWSTTVYIGITE